MSATTGQHPDDHSPDPSSDASRGCRKQVAAMIRDMRMVQFLLGIEGLALLRQWLGGDDHADVRLAEMVELCECRDGSPLWERVVVAEEDARSGYARWSETYDTLPNPLIQVEQPAVRSLLAELPAGPVLDAACGTGRHAVYLEERGHKVIGLDLSAEMLGRARAKAPRAAWCLGDLCWLPLRSSSLDAAVCSLALTHVRQLQMAIRELARVVRPGGRLILSDIHPFVVAVGGQAIFGVEEGGLAFVRNELHLPSAYVAAFRRGALRIEECLEIPFREEQAPVIAELLGFPVDVVGAAFTGLPAALIWHLEREG